MIPAGSTPARNSRIPHRSSDACAEGMSHRAVAGVATLSAPPPCGPWLGTHDDQHAYMRANGDVCEQIHPFTNLDADQRLVGGVICGWRLP